MKSENHKGSRQGKAKDTVPPMTVRVWKQTHEKLLNLSDLTGLSMTEIVDHLAEWCAAAPLEHRDLMLKRVAPGLIKYAIDHAKAHLDSLKDFDSLKKSTGVKDEQRVT